MADVEDYVQIELAKNGLYIKEVCDGLDCHRPVIVCFIGHKGRYCSRKCLYDNEYSFRPKAPDPELAEKRAETEELKKRKKKLPKFSFRKK